MIEKTPLRKLADIRMAETELFDELIDEIKSVFEELECGGLDMIEFRDYEVWIHLKESCLISTDLFSMLNKYFHNQEVCLILMEMGLLLLINGDRNGWKAIYC